MSYQMKLQCLDRQIEDVDKERDEFNEGGAFEATFERSKREIRQEIADEERFAYESPVAA